MRPSIRRSVAAIFAALAAMALIAGLVGRFEGLGSRPWSEDEYYFLSSVEFVLDTGLPSFPSGGSYVRGLAAQYATAASVLALGETDLARRLPFVLAGLAAIAATLLYARLWLPWPVAVAVAAMLAASSWHIEFSRFARMYVPFQLVTLLYLIAMHRAFFGGRWRERYLPHGLAFLAVLLHSQAVLLAPLLFTPYLLRGRAGSGEGERPSLGYGVASALTCALLALWVRGGFRNIGVVDRYPADYVATSLPLLRLPAFPFWTVAEDPLVNLGAVGIVLLVVGGVLAFAVRRGRASPAVVFGALAACAALAHSLALAGIFGAVLVLRYGLVRDRAAALLLASATLAGLAWVGVAFTSSEWVALVEPGDLPRAFRRTFLGFPDFYPPVVAPWISDLPWMGGLIGLVVAVQVILHARDPLPALLRNPSVVVLWIALCISLLNTSMIRTRYVFFIYPVMLTVVALTILEVGGRLSKLRPGCGRTRPLLAATAALALFLALDDFHPAHALAPSEGEASFRTGHWERYWRLWYPRSDVRSPAERLKGVLGSGVDEAVIAWNEPSVSRYLPAGHAVYYPREEARFQSVSRARGTIDAWTSGRLLSTLEEVRIYTRGRRAVWLVGAIDTVGSVDLFAATWGDAIGRVRFTGLDGRIGAVRVDLGAAD